MDRETRAAKKLLTGHSMRNLSPSCLLTNSDRKCLYILISSLDISSKFSNHQKICKICSQRAFLDGISNAKSFTNMRQAGGYKFNFVIFRTFSLRHYNFEDEYFNLVKMINSQIIQIDKTLQSEFTFCKEDLGKFSLLLKLSHNLQQIPRSRLRHQESLGKI